MEIAVGREWRQIAGKGSFWHPLHYCMELTPSGPESQDFNLAFQVVFINVG